MGQTNEVAERWRYFKTQIVRIAFLLIAACKNVMVARGKTEAKFLVSCLYRWNKGIVQTRITGV